MMRSLCAALLLAASLPAAASSGAALPFDFKPSTGNVQSLQRGARDYMAYCSGCHSLKYLRYNRVGRDLGIPEDLVEKHLMRPGEKPGDHIMSTMPKADSEKWFGRVPPDLSLTARERGADWVFSYLMSFYLDPSKPTGVNNLVLPGASMPHVLGDLQGWQAAHFAEVTDKDGNKSRHFEKFEVVQAGTLKPAEYREMVGDVTNFLVYAAEPGRNERISLGVKVMLFLLVFTGLTYLLKVEYWKDVH